MVAGFGLQTELLDLHIGSEILCVRGSEIMGTGCVTQQELADPESRAQA